MEPANSAEKTWWWILAIPTIFDTNNYGLDNSRLTVFSIIMTIISICLLTSWLRTGTSGGLAWKSGRTHIGRTPIPGIHGLPLFGCLFSLSHGLAHRTLARMALNNRATSLMAFSLGSTPVVVASEPETAREILTSPHFANRPLKQSVKSLMFSRAIGFAPDGTYWRLLRKLASSHLFAPGRIAAHEAMRRLDCSLVMESVEKEQKQEGHVVLRKHIQGASLNNIMGSVFGTRYDLTCPNEKVQELNEIVREGFELLGAFNWCDYVPWLSYFYDPFQIKKRCLALVPRVRRFVKDIIEEHRVKRSSEDCYHNNVSDDNSDFVHVLLSMEGEEKLNEDDMVAVLWEMIFRGTDTTALLTEWVMAELVVNPQVQDRLQQELQHVDNMTTHCDLLKLPYLQAVIKETLRLHPPGPLLSWARLSTSNLHLTNGMVVPAHTTAMVNMWAITHDPCVWPEPLLFKPERFLSTGSNEPLHFDILGGDLRLAPFGAGRRSCPGKNLGLAVVSLWVAELVCRFKWDRDKEHPVDLSEVLKLSCEMKYPLSAIAVPRKDIYVKR